MSIDDLLHVEHDLRDQNSRIDKHTASLRSRLEKLRSKQQQLEAKQLKAGKARDYEVRQRRERERELDRAHASLHAKQKQVQLLNEQVVKLRGRIKEMSGMVDSLTDEKHRLQTAYAHPSLHTALVHDALRTGPVGQHVVNRSLEQLLPMLQTGLLGAQHMSTKINQSPPVVALFTSFVLYIFIVLLGLLMYRTYKNICRKFTIVRSLLIMDLTFMAFWTLIIVTYIFMSIDPFYVLAFKHNTLSLIFQFLLIGVLAVNVLLRCLFLSLSLTRAALIEFFAVIFLTQHFYQSVWKPIVVDVSIPSAFVPYVIYLAINAALAVHRARTMGRPVENLRREFDEVDGILRVSQWLKVKGEAFFNYCEEWLTSESVVYDETTSIHSHLSRHKKSQHLHDVVSM